MNKDLAMDLLTYALLLVVSLALYNIITTGYESHSYDQGFYDGMKEICNINIFFDIDQEGNITYFCGEINTYTTIEQDYSYIDIGGLDKDD